LSDLKIKNLEKPGFIDSIFEFREEHRTHLLNEDDCFSRDVCELTDSQPKCERCREYVSKFEDVDCALLLNKDLRNNIQKYLKDYEMKIDTGYFLIHTQWIIDYLQS
jgi:hypothetical protein